MARRKPKSPRKPYQDLTADELRSATAEYDAPRPGRGLPGRPLSAEDQAWWKSTRPALRKAVEARRKAALGRPRVGEGVKVISLSIEQGLLRRADALARKRGLTRAALISKGLEALLSAPNRRIA